MERSRSHQVASSGCGNHATYGNISVPARKIGDDSGCANIAVSRIQKHRGPPLNRGRAVLARGTTPVCRRLTPYDLACTTPAALPIVMQRPCNGSQPVAAYYLRGGFGAQLEGLFLRHS